MKKIKLFLNLFFAVSLFVSMLTVSSCNVSEPSNNNSQSTENSSSQQSNISESSQSPEELGWKESEKHEGIMYNNTAKASDLITETYPEDKITYLKKHFSGWGKMTYDHFSSIFNVQCLRKTDQGYYAVIMQDDGKRVFFFINDDLYIKQMVLTVDQFKTKEEFDTFLLDKNNNFRDKILEFDSNIVEPPFTFSSLPFSTHIIQEGIILINYNKFTNNRDSNDVELLTNPVVDSVEFIANNDFDKIYDLNEMASAVYAYTYFPHILEIDKINP